METYEQLKGRLAWVYRDGWRVGKIARVVAGKRTGLRKLRLCASQYEGDGRFTWKGKKYTVDQTALRMRGAGVLWRGRVIAFADFVAKGGAR